jgi:Cdc6-like AAA superfamily ATPase
VTNHTLSSSLKQPCLFWPFPKNKRFVGRNDIMGTLEERLFTTMEYQKFAVVGLGGVGKTQVALQFAHWVKDNKPEYSVFWVPALSFGSFEQAYAEIAKKLGLRESSDKEDVKDSVQQHLGSDGAGKWLLVVDNADDMDLLYSQ